MGWLLIVFALAMSPLILLFVKFQSRQHSIVQPPPPPPDPVFFSVGAGILLLIAIGWTFMRVRPRQEVGGQAELRSVGRFQADSLVALALSEAAALLGFVAAPPGSASIMIPFVAGSLVVTLLVILPVGLIYWRLREEQGE
jgi:hypothetical protein